MCCLLTRVQNVTEVLASIFAATIHCLLLSTLPYNNALEGLAVNIAIVRVVDARD